MKKPLIAGTTLILAGVVAFALSRDDRQEKTADTPVAQAPAPEAAPVELADPGTIEAEVEPVADELPAGWEIDEDGHVWEPLSFDKPQVRHNPDGSIVMRKLIRVYQDGVMTEKPVTVTGVPVQKRLPVQHRVGPKAPQVENAGEVQTSSAAEDGK